MAWHNGGDWSTIPTAELSTVLAECCYAVNEREAHLGITYPKTEWPFTIPKSYPTAADFHHVRFADVMDWVDLIRDAIEAVAVASKEIFSGGWVFYVNPSTWGPLTVTDLLDAAGYGTSWLTPTRAQQKETWLQLRAVLDALKYISYPLGVVLGSGTVWVAQNSFDPTPTQQTAWDSAVANIAPSTTSFSLLNIVGRAQTFNKQTLIRQKTEWRFSDHLVAAGVISGAVVQFYDRGVYVGQGPIQTNWIDQDPFDVATDMGEQHTVDVSSATDEIDWRVVRDASWFPDCYISLEQTSIPASHPFGTISVLGDYCAQSVALRYAYAIAELQVGTDLTYG